MHRSIKILVAGALAISAYSAPSLGAADTLPSPLLPDLGMAPLEDFKVERKGAGVTWLRFSTIVVNVGDGPFEVVGYPAVGDGSDRRSDVDQLIHQTDGSTVPSDTPAYMFWSGDGHSHWHVFGFQRWELTNVSTPAGVLATGKKTGFCFWDNYLYGSSTSAWYHPNTTDACDPATAVTMGLSIGWGDEYPAGLTDQYIDISGLPWGEYLLTVSADPLREFHESVTTNNTVRAHIRINRNSVDVLGQDGYVQPLTSTTDDPPSVVITSPADGAAVSGTVTAEADALDDHGVGSVEFFVDGSSIGVDAEGTDGWSAAWDTAAGTDGAHRLSATATDTAGGTATDEIAVNVANDGAGGTGSVHVGDLDGSASTQGSRWSASASVTVHDNAEAPAAGAIVSGSWTTAAATEPDSCMTGTSGTCLVDITGVHKRDASATFTVTDVSSSVSPYDATLNHDPDGDSDGTRISVSR